MSDTLSAYLIFQAVFLMLDAYVYARTNRDIARKEERTYFSSLIFIHVVYIITNSIWSLQEYDVIDLQKSLIVVVCMISLLCVSCCAYVFFRFTCVRIRFRPLEKGALRNILAIPQLIIALLIVTSPLTGLIYSINESGSMVTGPAYICEIGLGSLYLLGVIAMAVNNLLKAKTYAKKLSSSALIASVTIIILFIVIDTLLSKATILPAAVFAVIIVVFITMQESNINSDALTGLNNRRRSDEYLAMEFNTISEEDPLYLFIGDVDKFKGINDKYGHLEGDEALILCARSLNSVATEHGGFTARFGGDEFLMSFRPAKTGEGASFDPEAVINEVEEDLAQQVSMHDKPYHLGMSLGYVRCAEPEWSFQKYLSAADEMLYLRKKEREDR